METRTERSELTLAAIVDAALDMALVEGLEGLSLGELAKRLQLSKSGVFSRVGSREALQIAVIDEFNRRFLADVFTPAMREPRGLPRLRAIVQRWLRRLGNPEAPGACLYSAGAFEYDDREGPVRAHLLESVIAWRAALQRSVQQAMSDGHLRADTDAAQLAFEIEALMTALVRELRFLRDPGASARAEAACRRLLDSAI